MLFLEKADIKREISFDDSYLKIKLDSYTLKLPIVVSFVRCKIHNLKFKEQAIFDDYEVGSGEAIVLFPLLIQQPECGI